MQSLKAPLLPSLTSVTFSYHVNLPVNVSVNLQKFLFFLSPFFPLKYKYLLISEVSERVDRKLDSQEKRKYEVKNKVCSLPAIKY